MTRRTLGAAWLISSIGDGAYYVCSALYFTRIAGLSPGEVGLGLTLAWAVGAVAGVPLGHLADRRGTRGTAALLAVLTGCSVSLFTVVHSFPAFAVAAVCYASCQSGLEAARLALMAGLVEPSERTAVRAYLKAVANAGLALGAAAGGLALHFDTRAAYLTVFVLDALSFVLAGRLLRRLPAPARPAHEAGAGRLEVLRDRPYAVVTLLNTVMLLYMPLLSLVLPLWIVRRTGAPAWLASALLVLNTASVLLFQVRLARGVTGLPGAIRSVRLAGLVMFAACAVFALSSGASAWAAAGVLLCGAALQALGEMVLGAGSWEIGFGLAPDGRQGQYQGFYGSGIAVARMIGPLLLTTLVISWGVPGWLTLGALFLAAALALGPATRWAATHRPTPPSTPTPTPTRSDISPIPLTP
jgi:MFS family permease